MTTFTPQPLITDDQVIAHLRLDSIDDAVTLYLAAATEAAMQYLSRRVYATTDDLAAATQAEVAGCDPMVMTAPIQAAILLTLGHLYANREDVYLGTGVAIQMPRGANSLLQPFRIGMGV